MASVLTVSKINRLDIKFWMLLVKIKKHPDQTIFEMGK